MLEMLFGAAALTCVIVYPADHQSRVEIRNHEFAHCNGWTHPEGRRTNFKRAFQAPPELYRTPYPGRVVALPLTLPEVLSICNGHLGCQWFE
jgi:hypothetical protein